MNLDAAIQSFQQESCELLEEMEEILLQMDGDSNGTENIDALFRAIHTIKGTAGIFGFERLVSITHVSENLLDNFRRQSHALTQEEIELFLECKDLLQPLVDAAARGAALDHAHEEQLASLIARFNALLETAEDGVVTDAAIVTADTEEAAASARIETIPNEHDKPISNDNWHLSLRFERNVLSDGMDPASFINYLAKLGDIVWLETLGDGLPPLAEMNAEDSYLGFEIAFSSDADRDEILDVFEFVREDAQIRLLPPRAKISEYIQLINSLDEDTARVGELLVASGALSSEELAYGLKLQENLHENNLDAKLGEVLVQEHIVDNRVVDAALTRQDTIRASSKILRVNAEKLDSLIDLVGEMVITGASAHLQAEKTGDESLLQIMFDLKRLVEEIRDNALHLRMVQIGNTFNKFRRVVRDVGQQMEKEIDLTINGGDTELDKTYVDKLNDPLTHLVRNAIDHGIEMPEVRKQGGKAGKGEVTLNAFHESGNVVIQVSDDGAGLDKARILAKAREKGLIEENLELSDQEIYALIFAPGFSTAHAVTDISGRGVGMDVVRRNIEDLRGTIEVDSAFGHGTTFSIRLPLTLAIIDGFLISVAKSAYVIPLQTVVECIELDDLTQQRIRHQNYINLRDEVLPCIHLRQMFECDDERRTRESIVVVQSGRHRAGLVVDELLGEFQTVIKPIGRIFEGLEGISGATILGSGEVAIILDVDGILNGAIASEGSEAKDPMSVEGDVAGDMQETLNSPQAGVY